MLGEGSEYQGMDGSVGEWRWGVVALRCGWVLGFLGESGGKFLCVDKGVKVVECCVRGQWGNGVVSGGGVCKGVPRKRPKIATHPKKKTVRYLSEK